MEPIGYDKRKASKLMQSKGVNILIASSPENIFYASGLPTTHAEENPILYILSHNYPSAVVISDDGEESLITWQLFGSIDKVSWIKSVSGILSRNEAMERLTSLIKEAVLPEGGTIGIESKMPYYQSSLLVKEFPEAHIRVSDDIFIEMRLEKSAEEIRRIRESTRVAERALEAMIGSLKEGMSATELVKLAKRKIIDEGGSGFDHITLGMGGSDPEYPRAAGKMKENDLVRLDIGAVYEGYCSDIGRHASIGAPPEGTEAASNLMIDIQRACVDVIKPGVESSEVVETAEATYRKSGGEGFYFLTIHSVGIQMEEYIFYDTMLGPSLKPFSSNMVIDVESWTLLPPHGFVGIEDTYFVNDSGCERISTLERKIYDATRIRKTKSRKT